MGNPINEFLKRVGIYLPKGKSDKKSYPAVKIGRLGVGVNHQNNGMGKAILDYTKDSFVNNNKTGCNFIVVDAYKDSVDFYKKMDLYVFQTRIGSLIRD